MPERNPIAESKNMAETDEKTPTETPSERPPERLPLLRLGVTSFFMGMANLVPGVSGGTMVLALGLYEEFIGGFSDLTRLRFSRRSFLVVGILFGGAALTILFFAGVIQALMERSLPSMFALFIGMTLGGVPMLSRQMRPVRPTAVGFTLAGVAVMALIAFVLRPDTANPSWLMLFAGGVVGSAAMILPGISGSYMLLILGLYLPIIAGISEFKDALGARDISMVLDVGARIILPVGLGVVAGLVALANLLRYLLEHRRGATIGFLMGLLLGSVLGLYPFKETHFDKLPRYAVGQGQARELRVIGFGWRADQGSAVFRNLSADVKGCALRVLEATDRAISEADIDRARRQSAVVIAYDADVPRTIRRRAADKELGEVQLQIVPNTEFSAAKAALAVLLACVGFAVTFFLGRLGRNDERPA